MRADAWSYDAIVSNILRSLYHPSKSVDPGLVLSPYEEYGFRYIHKSYWKLHKLTRIDTTCRFIRE